MPVARGDGRPRQAADGFSEGYGAEAEALCADPSSEDGMGGVAERIVRDVPDVLVNNAGFGDYGPFAGCDVRKQERTIELNVRAPAVLAHAAPSGMGGRGSGRMLNTASAASFRPGR